MANDVDPKKLEQIMQEKIKPEGGREFPLDVAGKFPMVRWRRQMAEWGEIHEDMMKRNTENDTKRRKLMTKNISRRIRTLRRSRARAVLWDTTRRPATFTCRLTRRGVHAREPPRAFDIIFQLRKAKRMR